MEYSEWINKSEDEMADLKIDGVKEMLSKIPYGMLEYDEDKQKKIASMLLVYCGSALISRNEEFISSVGSICSSLIMLFPDNTHAQSFCYGVRSVLQTVENATSLMKQQASAS